MNLLRWWLPPILLLSSAPAFADILIGSNAAGDEIRGVPGTLRVTSPDREMRAFQTVQLLAVLSTGSTRRSGPQVERMLLSFDCAARTMEILTYFKRLPNGTRTHDWRAADLALRYEPVRPGSMTEIAMRYACSGGRETSIYQPPVIPLPASPLPTVPPRDPAPRRSFDEPDGN